MNLTEANHILRLTDHQLAIVRQVAVPLSPSARDRYLKTVAARPSPTPCLADSDLVQ
jgi:hypothetical protein